MTKIKSIYAVIIILLLITSCSTENKKANFDKTISNDSKSDSILTEKSIPLNSLTEVLQQLEPPTETFRVNSEKETLITGNKGTTIYFPENTFQFADGTVPKGEVIIELKECYSLSAMIGSNLHTSSGDQLLETGGMLYIKASSSGKELSVKNDKAVVIGFPKQGNTNVMELFYSERETDSTTTWVSASANNEVEAFDTVPEIAVNSTTSNDYIEFSDDLYDYNILAFGDDILFKKLLLAGDNQITLPVYIEETLNKDSELVEEFYKKNWKLAVSLKIDENGKLYNWKCSEDNRFKNVGYNLDIPLEIKQVVFDLLETASALNINSNSDVVINKMRYYTLNIINSRTFNKERYDAKVKAKKDSYKAEFNAVYMKYKDSAIQKMDKKALNSYILVATQLGWINCDRFLDIDQDQKTDLMVNIAGSNDAQVQLIFEDINSIMNGYYSNGKIVFTNVPIGRAVKLIGISYANGKPTMAVEKFTISKEKVSLTNFQEFSLSNLERELNGMR